MAGWARIEQDVPLSEATGSRSQEAEILDVSVPVRPGMVVYEGDPGISLRRVSSLADGDVANVSELCCGVHTGTHVDAPTCRSVRPRHTGCSSGHPWSASRGST